MNEQLQLFEFSPTYENLRDKQLKQPVKIELSNCVEKPAEAKEYVPAYYSKFPRRQKVPDSFLNALWLC